MKTKIVKALVKRLLKNLCMPWILKEENYNIMMWKWKFSFAGFVFRFTPD